MHAGIMCKKTTAKTLLVALSLMGLLATSSVQAGYMGFTVKSLQTTESDGC